MRTLIVSPVLDECSQHKENWCPSPWLQALAVLPQALISRIDRFNYHVEELDAHLFREHRVATPFFIPTIFVSCFFIYQFVVYMCATLVTVAAMHTHAQPLETN